MKIFQCLHDTSLLSGAVKIDGSATDRLPRVQFMQDWRLAQPRTVARGGKALEENGGTYLAYPWRVSPADAVRKELARQEKLFIRPGQSNMVLMDVEDPRPCWEKTDLLTRETTLRVAKEMAVSEKSVASQFGMWGSKWTIYTIDEISHQTNLRVGVYDPCPWDESVNQKHCISAAKAADWIGIPLYVHFGYSSEVSLRSPEWFRDHWSEKVARYRKWFPTMPLYAISCPVQEIVRGPGKGKRILVPEAHAKMQIVTARDLGMDVIVWDNPATQADFEMADDRVKLYRKVVG